MSDFSKFKSLAINFLLEKDDEKEAVLRLAQEVLNVHLEAGKNELDDTLMPEEEAVPMSSDAYHHIENLVSTALQKGIEDINELV